MNRAAMAGRLPAICLTLVLGWGCGNEPAAPVVTAPAAPEPTSPAPAPAAVTPASGPVPVAPIKAL
jgi:hypothetical protein